MIKLDKIIFCAILEKGKEKNMGKNLSSKDNPIQYRIARLKKRLMPSPENRAYIKEGLLFLGMSAALIYLTAKLPEICKKIVEGEKRVLSNHYFEQGLEKER